MPKLTAREERAEFSLRTREIHEHQFPFEIKTEIPNYDWEILVEAWLLNHIGHKHFDMWIYRASSISHEEMFVWFSRQEDAIVFKLTWGGST